MRKFLVMKTNGLERKIKMTLYEIAKQEQELLNDGIMSLVVYKKGRSWGYLELYCCDFVEGEGFQWSFDEESQRQKVLNIMEIDSNAVIINGYDSPIVQGSVQKIYDGLKYAYNSKHFLLSNEKESILKEECTMSVLARDYPKEFTVRYIIPEIVDYIKSKNQKGISMNAYYESDIGDYPELEEYHKDDYDFWLEDTGELVRFTINGEEYIQLVEETKEETQESEDIKTKENTTKKIYEEKEHFVRTSLKELLFDADRNILDVYYQHDNATNEEFVTILYANCNKDMLNKKEYERICVTGDSLLALVNDVAKRLLA